jgi:hypothetical protein
MTYADKARFHSDPANWKLGIFYFCPSDPRIFVPKRMQGFGWTLNLARPMAVPFFLLLVALIPCAGALARSLGAGSETRFIVVLFVAGCVLAFLHWRSRRAAMVAEPKTDSEQPAP